MRLSFWKQGIGNGWVAGCGIEFNLTNCLKFWRWRIRQFYYSPSIKVSLVIKDELVISIHRTFDDANFITGPQWVVIRFFKWHLRLLQLS